MTYDTQALIATALVGLVAGWLAFSLVGSAGSLIQYLLSGIIGSFVGGYVLAAAGLDLGIKNPLLNRIVTATIGAIVVIFIARLIV